MARHRMLLSLDDNVHSLLMRLSELSGVPASTWVVNMLEIGVPQIEALIKTFEVVKTQPVQALDILNKMIVKSMVLGAQTQLDLLNDKERLVKELDEKKETEKER